MEVLPKGCSKSWDTIYCFCNRRMLQAVAMTASDLCASIKPWDVQLETVKVIFEEFYVQVSEGI